MEDNKEQENVAQPESKPENNEEAASQKSEEKKIDDKKTNPKNAKTEGEQKPVKDEAIKESSALINPLDPAKLGILNEVSIAVTIEVGRAQMKIKDLLNLTKGSVIELDKSAGDPVDIFANGKLISIGNIITVNGKYCVRLTSVPENKAVEGEASAK